MCGHLAAIIFDVAQVPESRLRGRDADFARFMDRASLDTLDGNDGAYRGIWLERNRLAQACGPSFWRHSRSSLHKFTVGIVHAQAAGEGKVHVRQCRGGGVLSSSLHGGGGPGLRFTSCQVERGLA